MNSKLYGMTVAFSAVAAMILSVDATAQTSAPTRADVKAEAAASAALLGTNRQGEQTVTRPTVSTESRAAKKAEARASGAMGANRVSEQSRTSQSQGAAPRPSEVSRADVKAGAASANKPGSDKPMGEASQRGQDKGVTKP